MKQPSKRRSLEARALTRLRHKVKPSGRLHKRKRWPDLPDWDDIPPGEPGSLLEVSRAHAQAMRGAPSVVEAKPELEAYFAFKRSLCCSMTIAQRAADWMALQNPATARLIDVYKDCI